MNRQKYNWISRSSKFQIKCIAQNARWKIFILCCVVYSNGGRQPTWIDSACVWKDMMMNFHRSNSTERDAYISQPFYWALCMASQSCVCRIKIRVSEPKEIFPPFQISFQNFNGNKVLKCINHMSEKNEPDVKHAISKSITTRYQLFNTPLFHIGFSLFLSVIINLKWIN